MTWAIAFAAGLVLGAGVWWRVARLRAVTSTLAGGDDLLDTMPAAGELRETLDAVAARVSSRLDGAPAAVRLFNARSDLFEARSFAGCDESTVARVSNTDVSRTAFDGLLRDGASLAGGVTGVAGDATAESGDGPLCDASHPSLWILPLPYADAVPLGYVAVATPAHLEDDELDERLSQLSAEALPFSLLVEHAILRGELRAKDRECRLAAHALGDLQRLKENFVSTVSHELRTPLTSIKAYAEVLSHRFDSMTSDEARDFSQVILRESVRLDETFDTILDVAQPDARMRFSRERFDLREVGTQLQRSSSDAFAAKGVQLFLESYGQPLFVHGDRIAISQVLRNLLDNALKFTAEGGEVHLRLNPEDGRIRIVVEDTGIGIPAGERERIFERFYQVDGSTTRSYGGQGLGLAICREIIEGHAGRIWAERAPEGGARFVVLLPRRGLVLHPRHEVETDGAERLQRVHFFQLVTSFVAETLRASIVSVLCPDEADEGLRIEAALGLEPDVVRQTYLRRGEGVAGLVWAEGRSVLAPDLDADPRFKGRSNEAQYPTRSLLSCPLLYEGKVVGVVNVNNKPGGDAFDDDDRLALEAVAERVARALVRFEEYARGYQGLRDSQTTLRAKLAVSRLRATATRRRLVACGLETGRRLGLDEENLRNLSYALHNYDLGLAEISPDILTKPGPLDAGEREQMHDHVRRGVDLVAELEPAAGVSKILQHHHENVDGSGYPHGSQGEAIPVGARIVRLVDTYCALVDARPYRPTLDPAAAVRELQRGIGRQYCPRVTPVFLSVLTDPPDGAEDEVEPMNSIHPQVAVDSHDDDPVTVASLEDR